MGRPAEPYKEKWRGHVQNTRDAVERIREHVNKQRAFLKVLRKVSEGEEAAQFLDEFAATIDNISRDINEVDVEQIALVLIGERAANNGDDK